MHKICEGFSVVKWDCGIWKIFIFLKNNQYMLQFLYDCTTKGNGLLRVVIQCNATVWNCVFLCLHIFGGKSKVTEQQPLEFPNIAQGQRNTCFSVLNHLSLWNAKKKRTKTWRVFKKTQTNKNKTSYLINKKKPEKSIEIPLVMPEVYMATNFILIKTG